MIGYIAHEAEHIYLVIGATDFSKQQTGLSALVLLKLTLDSYRRKSIFLFSNKKHGSLRALRWDGNGFILVTKFLSNEMKFQWPKTQGEVLQILIS